MKQFSIDKSQTIIWYSNILFNFWYLIGIYCFLFFSFYTSLALFHSRTSHTSREVTIKIYRMPKELPVIRLIIPINTKREIFFYINQLTGLTSWVCIDITLLRSLLPSLYYYSGKWSFCKGIISGVISHPSIVIILAPLFRYKCQFCAWMFEISFVFPKWPCYSFPFLYYNK